MSNLEEITRDEWKPRAVDFIPIYGSIAYQDRNIYNRKEDNYFDFSNRIALISVGLTLYSGLTIALPAIAMLYLTK